MTTTASKGSGPQARGITDGLTESESSISGTLRGWFIWLTTHVPSPIRKGVSDAFNTMRKKVVKLYSGKEEEEDQWHDARENLSDQDEQWHDANPEEDLKPVLTKHAMKRKARKYVITPNGDYDPTHFLTTVEHEVRTFLEAENKGRNVGTTLVCEMVRSDPGTGKEVSVEANFASGNRQLFGVADTDTTWTTMTEKMLKSFSEYQKRGSGWRLRRVVRLEVCVGEFRPFSGSKHNPLPKKIADKKAVINMENSDSECFKWAVTRALNPTINHPERVTKELRKQSEELDWLGVEFPTPIDSRSIKAFEDKNGININVFSADETHNTFPIRISGGYGKTTAEGCERRTVRLFLWDGHYSVVKSMSRLASSQLSRKEHKKFVCDACLCAFGTDELLKRHCELCLHHDHQRQIYPEPGSTVRFERHERTQEFPIAVYADFECYVEPLQEYPQTQTQPKESSTTPYQKHSPSGFSYYVKCMDDSILEPELVCYTQQHEGEDVAAKFVDSVEAVVHRFYNRTKDVKPITMTHNTTMRHRAATECYACGGCFTPDDYKVADHCHYTGRYRGAAHNSCNLRMATPKFVPVYFHNLEGYDAHLFVKNLGVTDGSIKCIPKTEERYISFSKELVVDTVEDADARQKKVKRELRFLDSFKLMSSSLNKLAGGLGIDDFTNLDRYYRNAGYTTSQRGLLKQKGVYPYEFMSEFSRLGETSLPSKDRFFSSLTGEHISDDDYGRAQNVWKAFGMKSMRDYHDLYLITDVLLLADIMESFRKVCRTNYGLDPLWYYTAPGLAWDATLKLTGAELDLISDPDMYLFIEEGIRGGISTITKRYAIANNKYMADYDPKKESKYLPYLDANNLYGWAMSQPLPYGRFEWMSEAELSDWKSISSTVGTGCILEVDLEYPDELHNPHNEYPLAPERVVVNKVEKLIPNLNNKTKYILHHKNLELYLNMGMKLTRVHRGIKFLENPWMKQYIQLNTDLRTKAITDFEKDFFKLMINSVFGKTMENLRKRVDIRIVNDESKWKTS